MLFLREKLRFCQGIAMGCSVVLYCLKSAKKICYLIACTPGGKWPLGQGPVVPRLVALSCCRGTRDLPPTLSPCNQTALYCCHSRPSFHAILPLDARQKCLLVPSSSLARIGPEAKAVLCTAPQHYPCIITQATLVPPCPVAKAKALGVCLYVYDSCRNAYVDLLLIRRHGAHIRRQRFFCLTILHSFCITTKSYPAPAPRDRLDAWS
eukprot:g19496.t1